MSCDPIQPTRSSAFLSTPIMTWHSPLPDWSFRGQYSHCLPKRGACTAMYVSGFVVWSARLICRSATSGILGLRVSRPIIRGSAQSSIFISATDAAAEMHRCALVWSFDLAIRVGRDSCLEAHDPTLLNTLCNREAIDSEYDIAVFEVCYRLTLFLKHDLVKRFCNVHPILDT